MSATHEDIQQLSLPELLSRVSDQTSRLVRQEVELAKAELAEKGKPLGIGAGLLVAGLALLVFGVGALTACIILAIAIALPAWAAAAITFGIWALIAGTLAMIGLGRIRKGTPPVPERTVASVKQDVRFTKERAKEGRA